jgi:hypothetical protein
LQTKVIKSSMKDIKPSLIMFIDKVAAEKCGAAAKIYEQETGFEMPFNVLLAYAADGGWLRPFNVKKFDDWILTMQAMYELTKYKK